MIPAGERKAFSFLPGVFIPGRKERGMRKERNVIYIGIMAVMLAVLPAVRGFGYTVPQVMAELGAHMGRIEKLSAEVVFESSGTGKVRAQAGSLKYEAGVGTVFRLEGETPMEALMKENGEVYLNGQRQTGVEKSHQAGDIYLLELLKNYRLEIEKEDGEYVVLVGYSKSEKLSRKKLLRAWFRKGMKVIDRVKYMGDEGDYPYDLRLVYEVREEVPVVKTMTTRVSAFSTTLTSEVKFSNIQLTKKASTTTGE